MIEIKNKLTKKLKHTKLLLFTHTDLDGYSCFIISKHYCNYVRFFMCDYSNIENKMREQMEQGNILDYDMVILSDLSISVSFAKEFHTYCQRYDIPFYIIDHHEKAIDIELDKLDFATVLIENKDKLTCGTELLNDFFIELGGDSNKALEDYIEQVRQYDVWDWKTLNNPIPRDWNTLYYLLPKRKFFESVNEKVENGSIAFNSMENLLLEMEAEKIKYYITRKMKGVIYRNILGYCCGIIFAEQYINELSEELKKDESVDIVIIIGFNGISYRTNKEIDLNQFAKNFGGGGHIKAAGSTIPQEAKDLYLNNLFNL